MATKNEKLLHDKLNKFDEQLDRLSYILDSMITKMDQLEEATKQLRSDMAEEMNELRNETNGEDRDT